MKEINESFSYSEFFLLQLNKGTKMAFQNFGKPWSILTKVKLRLIYSFEGFSQAHILAIKCKSLTQYGLQSLKS